MPMLAHSHSKPQQNSEINKTSSRVHLLDTLRGLALINMIFYHLAYDLVDIFGVNWPWYHTIGAFYWQQATCWTFILTSGASVHLSRHKFKRGLTVLACGLIITCITCVFVPKQAIPFGILTFLGLAIIITNLLKPQFKKVNPFWGSVASFLLFAVFRNFPWGFVGFFEFRIFEIPKVLYSTNFLFAIGLPNKAFPVVDYFSFIPWIFLFWTGYFGFIVMHSSRFKGVFLFNIPGLSFLGKHTLILYLLHQPILYGICYLIFA